MTITDLPDLVEKLMTRESAELLLQRTGYEVSIPLSSALSALSLEMAFELLKVLLGVGFDVEIKHEPPSLTIWRRRR